MNASSQLVIFRADLAKLNKDKARQCCEYLDALAARQAYLDALTVRPGATEPNPSPEPGRPSKEWIRANAIRERTARLRPSRLANSLSAPSDTSPIVSVSAIPRRRRKTQHAASTPRAGMSVPQPQVPQPAMISPRRPPPKAAIAPASKPPTAAPKADDSRAPAPPHRLRRQVVAAVPPTCASPAPASTALHPVTAPVGLPAQQASSTVKPRKTSRDTASTRTTVVAAATKPGLPAQGAAELASKPKDREPSVTGAWIARCHPGTGRIAADPDMTVDKDRTPLPRLALWKSLMINLRATSGLSFGYLEDPGELFSIVQYFRNTRVRGVRHWHAPYVKWARDPVVREEAFRELDARLVAQCSARPVAGSSKQPAALTAAKPVPSAAPTPVAEREPLRPLNALKRSRDEDDTTDASRMKRAATNEAWQQARSTLDSRLAELSIPVGRHVQQDNIFAPSQRSAVSQGPNTVQLRPTNGESEDCAMLVDVDE
ncbi:hypothetical protein AURDEDRAFT_128436 [Auricularia subglabra TFB-10046 SS5]|nr:hypothetical protein AURDEDRAFT_128436 [Auricularia subglabra TFB-10046 SS5]